MIAFTICSRNFFGFAQTLYETFNRSHPEVTFYVALCDRADDFDTQAFPFEVLRLDELGLPDVAAMADRYSITEFNTAIKPFAFQFLFDRHPGDTVLYLDPDIFVVSRFEELLALVSAGAECVLTPAITEPAEHAEFDDQQFLRYGIYNLGFCCLRDTPEVRRAVWWWARRLEFQCIIDLDAGLFVDQKWADLLPAFIERTRILHHPGYNVAYWNLPQRRVSLERDEWCVNGVPLRFFHFSGNKIEDESVFSRHSTLLQAQNIGSVGDLLADYRSAVRRHGQDYFSGIAYAFNWGGTTGENLHTPESLEHERRLSSVAVPYLPVSRWRSQGAYDTWRGLSERILVSRQEAEEADIPAEETFALEGFCVCCEARRSFVVSGSYANRFLPDGRGMPNWREHLACAVCGFTNKQRAAYHILRQELRPSSSSLIYVSEYVTSYFKWLRDRFPATSGSEYSGPDRVGGDLVNGVPHEDIQALSFEDATFDLILSFDVLEHVPDEVRAFREMSRCLRPGGTLLMTVPTHIDRYDNEVRAVLSETGELTHLLEPEFHGNPIDSEAGSLCYRYYGWMVLDQLKAAGFNDAQIVTYWSQKLRYYGEPQLVIIARK